jgi:hypothetical protein
LELLLTNSINLFTLELYLLISISAVNNFYNLYILSKLFTIKIKVLDSNNNYILRRLSNGPIESFNNIPKNYKHISNGVSNFEYTRNRIIWATRENPSILGVPKQINKTKK